MRRTSFAQFEMMVTFMEEHGDLSKPPSDARARIQALNQWEELSYLLNCDGTGIKKPIEKWKKVWSDLKNNTKRKSARLHKAASGGGDTVHHAQLTKLEIRVLAIMGVEASDQRSVSPSSSNTSNSNGSTDRPGPSNLQPVDPLLQERNQSNRGPAHLVDAPPRPQARPSSPQPRRVMSSRPRILPQRHGRLGSVADQAAQHFLHSDSEWRAFKMEQNRAQLKLKKEQIRIREMELEVNRDWQALGSRCLDILERLASKFLADQ